MIREPVQLDARKSMHLARKKRIHEREGGLCWHCRLPVDLTGPDVRYDHVGVFWITGDDSDEAIKPAHTWCDAPKTALDQTTIAKLKRIIRKSNPETRKAKRPIRSRGFDKSKRRKFDGSIEERK